jgi:hypothetical protein
MGFTPPQIQTLSADIAYHEQHGRALLQPRLSDDFPAFVVTIYLTDRVSVTPLPVRSDESLCQLSIDRTYSE